MSDGRDEPLLSVSSITKRFGELTANDDIHFEIDRGEIHALLGENGAGKSTLVKILYGSLQPDGGQIRWQGRPVSVSNPAVARRLGIGMVFQHFSLFDALTVTENIALALPKRPRLQVLARDIARVSEEYGLPLNPMAQIHDLSVGQRQRVEIVRCLLQDPQLIIMDEPTSVLTPQEADDLFVTLRRLSGEGRSILYISHRLREVKELCSHVTILRHGKLISTCDPQEETSESLARLMVGNEIRDIRTSVANIAEKRVLLSVRGVSLSADEQFDVALQDISFDVCAGEVCAIAGIAGNGQSELFDALSGERTVENNRIYIDGNDAGAKGINERRKIGAAFVAEERLGHGTAPQETLSLNVLLTQARMNGNGIRGPFIDYGEAAEAKDRICKSFDVRKSSADPRAYELSGGNLQKFVVGREFNRAPKLLVINQPTWGVDAGASAHIRQSLIDLARAGAAVVVISQDLDEIFEIADRVAVLSRGKLTPFTSSRETSRETLGLLLGGAREGEAASAA